MSSVTRLKIERRRRRRKRVRKKVYGDSSRLRVSVFRSNKNVYAQIINDDEGKTVAAFSSLSLQLKDESVKGSDTKSAFVVGETLGKMALDKGVEKVVFDRGGYVYHGRVKALAEGLRKAGLKF